MVLVTVEHHVKESGSGEVFLTCLPCLHGAHPCLMRLFYLIMKELSSPVLVMVTVLLPIHTQLSVFVFVCGPC